MATNFRTKARLWTAVMLVGALGVLILSLGWLAPWATPAGKERAAAVNATRQTFLAALAGIVAVAGLATGGRTYLLSRRGQITDRYAKAVTLLASANSTERIGGIFALERLLNESPQDHETIVEVLTAFVRQVAPATTGLAAPEGDRYAVQSALTVIGRRPRLPESSDLNLARTDLRGMTLVDANLRLADLRSCRMERANLSMADCRGARLNGSALQHAELIDTDLRDADLSAAVLADADLDGAKLDGARLHGARFCDDHDHAPARSLTVRQLMRTMTDTTTRFPPAMRQKP